MNTATPSVGSPSPWGPVQHLNNVAPGIVQVSTASHGGLWLSAERWQQLRSVFPNFKPFCEQRQWLEEDCDAAIAALLWPDLFGIQAVRSSVKMFGRDSLYRPEVHSWLHLNPAGKDLVMRVALWEKANSGSWEPCGGGGNTDGWTIMFRRIGDGACREILLSAYPEKDLYTDRELTALASVGPQTNGSLAVDFIMEPETEIRKNAL